MNTLDVLKAARELLSDPAKWTKQWMAADTFGAPVAWSDPDAHCFCSLGAVSRVTETGLLYFEASRELRRTLDPAFPDTVSIADFNDAPERTHAEVLDLFDRTIARLEAANG